MPKQSIELRIEILSNSESVIENRKMDLLIAFANSIKNVQQSSLSHDPVGSKAIIHSSFASNVDLFKNLPNSLKDIHKTDKTNES